MMLIQTRRRIAGLAIADNLFQIGGEPRIHYRLEAHLFRMGFSQSQRLRQQPSARLGAHMGRKSGKSRAASFSGMCTVAIPPSPYL